jgi:phage tail protein X
LPPNDPPPNDGQQNSSKVFTYVVQPNDTLRALCLSVVGRYDEAVQQEIRELNPNLKDLTHLSPGQEIRLPLDASKPDPAER